MKVAIKDISGVTKGDYEIRLALVEDGRGTQAVHDVVVAHMAAQRSGTACTKTMGDVAGSGKKPWRQKGTGRARAGSFASPLWVGGGVVFGPKPRSFRKNVGRGTKNLALKKSLSERLKSNDVVIVENIKLNSAKTKEVCRILASLDLRGSVLIVAASSDVNLLRAGRNLPKVEITTSDDLNTYQVLRSDKLLFTREAFVNLEDRVNKG